MTYLCLGMSELAYVTRKRRVVSFLRNAKAPGCTEIDSALDLLESIGSWKLTNALSLFHTKLAECRNRMLDVHSFMALKLCAPETPTNTTNVGPSIL